MLKAPHHRISSSGEEPLRVYGTYASTSMLTLDFSSTVMWSSQMVICLIQRRTSDSSKSVM